MNTTSQTEAGLGTQTAPSIKVSIPHWHEAPGLGLDIHNPADLLSAEPCCHSVGPTRGSGAVILHTEKDTHEHMQALKFRRAAKRIKCRLTIKFHKQSVMPRLWLWPDSVVLVFSVFFVCFGKWYSCYQGQGQIPGGQEHSWPTSLVVRNFGTSPTTVCRHTEEIQV